jgi:hypothetical protein
VLRRTLILGLIGGGLLLVGIGVQRWFDRQAGRNVATDFMAALKQGDREAAMSHLDPAQRSRAEVRFKKAKAGSTVPTDAWTPVPGVQYRVYEMHMDGYQAVVTILMQKNGFAMRPKFYLRRASGTRWKIAKIDGLEVDPRWHDLQQARARAQGDRLAEELAKELGVTVEREAPGDDNRAKR